MTNFRCLLCLSSLDSDIGPRSAKRSSIKAEIVRLYDLLVPQHRTSSPHKKIIEQIEDSDGFKLCQDCFLSAKEIEQIKQQLSQLEEQIARKVQELKTTVSNSFAKDEKIDDSLQKIRRSLLSLGEETAQNLTDFKVKLEPEDNLMHHYQEQFPPQDDLPCPSPAVSNQSSEGQDDPLFPLDADEVSNSSSDDGSNSSDDSDFYITPDIDKNMRTKRTKTTKSRSSSPPKRKRVRKYVPKRKKYDESCYTFSCAACLARFRREKHLTLHLRQEHKGFCQFQCQICQKKYETQGLLDSHMIMRHETEEKSFFCTKCEKGFTLEVNFQSHLERHKLDESKPVVCTVCDARFINQAHLEKHNAVHATWTCAFCGLTLATKRSWQRHVRSHTGERPYKCDQCEESFIDPDARKAHITRSHLPERHACPICGREFGFKRTLKAHVDKVHENVKRYECSECGEKFKDGEALNAHNIREHNAAPIVCEECGDTFTSASGFKRHKITHTGVKRHACDICGARFFFNAVLQNHLRTHSDDRNQICYQCGKGFKTGKNLSRHVKTVHGEKLGRAGAPRRSKIGTSQAIQHEGQQVVTESEILSATKQSNLI